MQRLFVAFVYFLTFHHRFCLTEFIRTKLHRYIYFHWLQEIEQATDVMNGLQGNLLSSSGRGGMPIE